MSPNRVRARAMKRREERLQAILEILGARPEGGLDPRRLVGRVCAEFGVAPSTVQEDLEDLELRGYVARVLGAIRLTPVGRKRSGRPLAPAKGQLALEDDPRASQDQEGHA